MKPGDYVPEVQKKGVNEAFIEGIKEGQVYWTVKLDNDGLLDVRTQSEAITISRIIRLEQRMEKMIKELNKSMKAQEVITAKILRGLR